jgi:hypothetical protein
MIVLQYFSAMTEIFALIRRLIQAHFVTEVFM